MTPEQFRQVEEIFQHARVLPAAERDAFILAACREDVDLSDEVRALLCMANLEAALDSLRLRVQGSGGVVTLSGPPDAATSRPLISTDKGGAVGNRIAGYTIVREIGRGGMGVIYEAVQERLHRKVALKVLPTGIGGASGDAISRFRREATAAAKLHHTHIVPIYDFGQFGGTYYYAMEMIDGHSLTEMIRRFSAGDAISASETVLAEILSRRGELVAPGDPGSDSSSSGSGSFGSGSGARHRSYFRHVARWMADAADALHYAHGHGIIHRDIKPGNLMLCSDGRIMVLDFGLARMTSEMSATMTGSLLGTLRYMSPEQAMAKRVKIDHRTDIYSLGATMYELLTFQAAFKGADEKETLGLIITKDATPPRKVIPQVPRELETICLKTLEKDPVARYATARELADDLRRFSQDLPIMAKPTGPIGRVIKFVRRRRAFSIAACSIVLLGATSVIATRSILDARKRANDLRIKTIENLVDAGVSHSRNQEWPAAAKSYEEALALDSKNFRALVNLVEARRKMYGEKMSDQQFKECDELLRRALDVNPRDAQQWNAHGVFLRLHGKYDEAIRVHQSAIQIDDGFYANWVSLASALAMKQDLPQAEICLLKAVDIPNAAINHMPWHNLAAVQHQLGKPEALAAIERAVAIKPGDPAAMLLMARILLDRPEEADRKRGLDMAITADNLGGTPQVRARAARVRALGELRTGDSKAAIRTADRALELKDEAAWPRLIQAIAEARLGRKGEARGLLDAARVNHPADLSAKNWMVLVEQGFLWFESRAELDSLQREAEALLK